MMTIRTIDNACALIMYIVYDVYHWSKDWKYFFDRTCVESCANLVINLVLMLQISIIDLCP